MNYHYNSVGINRADMKIIEQPIDEIVYTYLNHKT